MPCSDGCRDGRIHFSPSTLQVLTESSDPEKPIFGWSMPTKFYAKPGRMLIYGTCLAAGTTRKGDTFSKAELERHGCTLIGGPVEAYGHSWDDGLNHWLPYPANVILDAEEYDGQLEYIAAIEDAAVHWLSTTSLIRVIDW